MVILQPFPVLRGKYLGARCPHHSSSGLNFYLIIAENTVLIR